jgi:Glycosyl transferase family 2
VLDLSRVGAVMGAPGCDDAPVVVVPLKSKARLFTLIMPYYDNPRFLERQIMHLLLLGSMEIIIVDDGSPTWSAEEVMRRWAQPNVRLFRIDVDVRWNWLAARNVGAHHAKTEWMMLTDMDHMLPEGTWTTLAYGEFDPGTIYRFSRVGAKTHPHPNSWFMTRDMYWKIGGYDEALSGHYGTDGEYRRRCAATAPIRIMADPLELHEHEEDASTRGYLRKQPEDARGKQLVKARRAGWKPKVLSFPYHEVELR